jgi:hypothetical protein
VATLEFFAGFETGELLTSGYSVNAGAPTVVTTNPKSGTYCLECVAVGSSPGVFKTIATTDYLADCVDFYIDSGSSTQYFYHVRSGASTNRLQFRRNGASGAVCQMLFNGVSYAGPAINDDTWYRLRVELDIAADPWVLNWSIDGVAQTQRTAALAGATLSRLILGTGGSNTSVIRFDNHRLSITRGDYPLADGYVLGYPLLADGTHNVGVGLFRDSGGIPITVLTTNAETFVDEVPMNPGAAGDYVEQQANDTAAYLEFTHAASGETDTIEAVAVAAHVSTATTSGSQQSMNLRDSGQDGVIFANHNIANVTGTARRTIFQTRPGGQGAWNDTAFNASTLRWGYAADADPDVRLNAAMLEVAFIPGPPAVSGTATWEQAAGAWDATAAEEFTGTATFEQAAASWEATGAQEFAASATFEQAAASWEATGAQAFTGTAEFLQAAGSWDALGTVGGVVTPPVEVPPLPAGVSIGPAVRRVRKRAPLPITATASFVQQPGGWKAVMHNTHPDEDFLEALALS